jgi:hypothetical protein
MVMLSDKKDDGEQGSPSSTSSSSSLIPVTLQPDVTRFHLAFGRRKEGGLAPETPG